MSEPKKTLSAGTIIQLFVFIILLPLLPILISRRWGWWEAWFYALFGISGFFVSRVLAARRHPGLIQERARMMDHENVKPWDKVLAQVVGRGGVLVPLAAGLDMRYGWSGIAFGLDWKIPAMLLIAAGYVFGAWALLENPFFSGVVRIQEERGHHVISSGPYAWVRHPGYAGAILSYLLIPILLDSLWTFAPAAVIIVTLVIRCALEDETLQAELPGYREYTRKTRYRLLPGVW